MRRASALLALIAACSSGGGGGDGAGTSPADVVSTGDSGVDSGPPPTDSAPTETTVGPTGCTTAADCKDGALCDCLGRCVPPGVAGLPACTADKNCGSGHYCDLCASACRVLKSLCGACEKDLECDEGGACLDFKAGGRYCLKACVANPGCPQPGFECKPVDGAKDKQCVPLSGVCEAPALCDKDGDCPVGDVCNGGQCGPGCPDDSACPDGKVCALYRCVPACPASPCPEGQECKPNGHCMIPGGCLEPKDCALPATYCHPDTHVCTPGCLADFDCKSAAKACKGGQCVEKGCTANFYCAFGEVCDLGTGKCAPAGGPYCEPGCDPESDTACGGKPNMCIKLQDKDGKDLGAFCFPACGPDKANACPQGYACEELKDDKGAVQGEICFRDCTHKPL